MKNSMGNDTQKFRRVHSSAILATLGASGGIAVPWLALASGVTDRLWDVADLVSLWEQYERRAERAA